MLINCYLLVCLARQQLLTVLSVLSSLFKTSLELRVENLALRTNSACCAGRHRSG